MASNYSKNGPIVEAGATLTPELLAQIQAHLYDVGAYGEVRLIVKKGQIRFIHAVKSMDARGFAADSDN